MKRSAKKVKDEARQKVIARRKVLRKREQRRQGIPQIAAYLTHKVGNIMAPVDDVPVAHIYAVWANPDSKIYYRRGSSRFAATKRGKLMPESEAVTAGYREAKS